MKSQDFLRIMPMLSSKRDNLNCNKFKLKHKPKRRQPVKLRKKLLRKRLQKRRRLLNKK